MSPHSIRFLIIFITLTLAEPQQDMTVPEDMPKGNALKIVPESYRSKLVALHHTWSPFDKAIKQKVRKVERNGYKTLANPSSRLPNHQNAALTAAAKIANQQAESAKRTLKRVAAEANASAKRTIAAAQLKLRRKERASRILDNAMRAASGRQPTPRKDNINQEGGASQHLVHEGGASQHLVHEFPRNSHRMRQYTSSSLHTWYTRVAKTDRHAEDTLRKLSGGTRAMKVAQATKTEDQARTKNSAMKSPPPADNGDTGETGGTHTLPPWARAFTADTTQSSARGVPHDNQHEATLQWPPAGFPAGFKS